MKFMRAVGWLLVYGLCCFVFGMLVEHTHMVYWFK